MFFWIGNYFTFHVLTSVYSVRLKSSAFRNFADSPYNLSNIGKYLRFGWSYTSGLHVLFAGVKFSDMNYFLTINIPYAVFGTCSGDMCIVRTKLTPHYSLLISVVVVSERHYYLAFF